MPLDVDNRKVAVGFLGAAIVLATLVYLVGTSSVIETLGLLDARSAGLITLSGICWLAAWGSCLRAVLGSLDVDVGHVRGFLLYASAAFANNVTPFGQAGGEPFSAFLISRATEAKYERSLAAIASVDSINFIPSIALALFGLSYYTARFTVGDRLIGVIAIVITLALGIPALAYLAWRHRKRVRRALNLGLAPLLRKIGGVVPGFTPPSTDSVRQRIAGFFDAIARVADDRHGLARAVAFSALGWFFLCLTLWLSLGALGHRVPFPIVFIIVPVATIASITPLPGGAGGVEFVLVLLLVPTTGVTAATAATAAIVYRGGTYWLSTALGAISALALQRRTTR